jgi:hypothetical protein
MNETPSVLDVGAPAVPGELSPAKTTAPGALSDRHHKYAEEFKQWMLGLNRADFAQAKRVLEQLTRAYFKHTIQVHSPPMRDANNDDSGKTSDGQPDPVLPAGDPAA